MNSKFLRLTFTSLILSVFSGLVFEIAALRPAKSAAFSDEKRTAGVSRGASLDDDQKPHKRLEKALLKLPGLEDSPADQAKYQLKQFLGSPQAANMSENDRGKLKDLAKRLLRPEELVRSQDEAVLIDLWTAETVQEDHPALLSLQEGIRRIESVLGSAVIQTAPFKRRLEEALGAYQVLLNALCDSQPDQQRRELLQLRVLIHSEIFDPGSFYTIPTKLAYTLLSCDKYGFTTKPNRAGTHAVYTFPEDKSAEGDNLYFKADLEGNHLMPGHEGISYALYETLFGGLGITPTCLITFQNLSHKKPEQGEALKRFERNFQKQSSTAFFAKHPHLAKEQFRDVRTSGVAQVSLGVRGEDLNDFIEGGIGCAELDPQTVSAHMIALYILGAHDAKGDNFYVTPAPEWLVIGIDNDLILEEHVRYKNEDPVLCLKSIFYCIPELMESELNELIRKAFLAKSAHEHMINFLRRLLEQDLKYQRMIEEERLDKDLAKHLSIPLKMRTSDIYNIYGRIKKISDILARNSQITHHELLKQLDQRLADYYASLREEYLDNPLNACDVAYGQGLSEKERGVQKDSAPLLGKRSSNESEPEEQVPLLSIVINDFQDCFVGHEHFIPPCMKNLWCSEARSFSIPFEQNSEIGSTTDLEDLRHLCPLTNLLNLMSLDLRSMLGQSHNYGETMWYFLTNIPSLQRVYSVQITAEVKLSPFDLELLQKARTGPEEDAPIAFRHISTPRFFDDFPSLRRTLVHVRDIVSFFEENGITFHVEDKTQQYCVGRLYMPSDWVNDVVNVVPSLFGIILKGTYTPRFRHEREEDAFKWLNYVVESSEDVTDEVLADAYYNIGLLYYYGQGIPQNLEEAKYNFYRAYEKNPLKYFLTRIKAPVTIGAKRNCSIQ